MTRTAIPVTFSDCQVSLVEIDPDVNVEQAAPPTEVDGIPPGTDAVADVNKLGRRFGDVQRLIMTVCTGLHDAIAGIPKPETVEVEFGVKLGGEGGVPMVTKATAEANFKIKIGWKFSPPPQTPPTP
jgi:hypothetical protein